MLSQARKPMTFWQMYVSASSSRKGRGRTYCAEKRSNQPFHIGCRKLERNVDFLQNLYLTVSQDSLNCFIFHEPSKISAFFI
jgi:hypothetical protein